MRAPVRWLLELVDHTEPVTGEQIAADLVRVGLEEEGLHGGDLHGPLVVGRVLSMTDEPQKNGKTIHFCTVDVGDHGQRAEAGGDPAVVQEIVCGAHNFTVGDLVVVVLPGAVLPGGFTIGARKTYGHMSHGMICSQDEIGLGSDRDGIIVLQRHLADRPEVVADLQPGDDAIALLGLDEEVVEVNVTPDRGYCFSMRGIAREYALATGSSTFRDPVAVPVPAASEGGYPVRLCDDSPIRGNAGCDRYVARIVRDVDAGAPSPMWLRRRLEQMGMRSISMAVDVTNYLMLLTGQPLHAFDLDALGGAIEVRRARVGERLRTLDDTERLLDPEDLLITDSGNTPLAIAGVMGGNDSEVTDSTRNLLIEAAHFDPITVARSSRRHKLSTEASRRYERGVDPMIAPAVAELAAQLLVEFGGGTIDPQVTDVGDVAPAPVISFDTVSAWKLVQPPQADGGSVPAGLGHDDVVAVLRAIGAQVSDPGPDHTGFATVEVQPPPWRPDLRNGPDLIEEVARVRGYEHIPSILPTAPGGRGLTPAQRSSRLVATLLAGAGLSEVWSYPFVAPATFDRLNYPPQDERRRALRLANPLSQELPLMRTSLLDTLTGTLRLNVARGNRDCALFEMGVVVRPTQESVQAPVPPIGAPPSSAQLEAMAAAVPPQPRHVAIAVTGAAVMPGPWGPGQPYSAADVITLVRSVTEGLGVRLDVRPDERAPWHPGRCAALCAPDGTVIGHAGELDPRVLSALELPERTCAAEFDLDAVQALAEPDVQVRTLSTFPVATSDVALVVDEQVGAGDLEGALRDGAGAELESVTLFDVYRGDQVGAGNKSLAFRLEFRADDRTLTTEEVSALRDQAISAAGARFEVVQRGA